MQHRTQKLVAIVALLATVAGVGAAIAAGGSQTVSKSAGRGAILGAVTSYLGITAQQLRADCREASRWPRSRPPSTSP